MTSSVFQTARDYVWHPLFEENYAWVDKRLNELYNIYALTSNNVDEFESNGLLTENYDWVDARLEELCQCEERGPLMLAPVTWYNYRTNADLHSIESPTRPRSEGDVSDYEEEVKAAIHKLTIQIPLYDENVSVNSLELGSDDEEDEIEDYSEYAVFDGEFCYKSEDECCSTDAIASSSSDEDEDDWYGYDSY